MKQSKFTTPVVCQQKSNGRRLLLLTSALAPALTLLGGQAYAQQEDTQDVIVVTGSRKVVQDSINLKRNSTQVVDGLSAEEIGDLPALSIGEALENVTGVASHRENGGATEVSIRGLGPYLSSTVVNGRAATNGSGDRSVNFSQFPSEMMSKLAVFKTQDASQLEGGVAGQIQLETLKPLEFGRRRFQVEAKGNINPDQLNQSDTIAGDIGYRVTGSYTDQFDVGSAGEIGLSIGYQRSDISQPEAEARQTGPTSNSRPACLITNGLAAYEDPVNGGTFTGFSNNPETADVGDDDCDDVNDDEFDIALSGRNSLVEGVDTSLVNGVAVDAGVPFVFAPSQRHFRQNDTRDERDAIFGGFQWQPSDRVDINFDVQWSERKQSELRNDLTFNGGRRNDTSLNIGPGGSTTTLDSLEYTDTGAVLYQITDNTIEVQGGDFQRVERYFGGGLNIDYAVTDRLTVSLDASYSDTERMEQAKEFRIQSNLSPVIVYDRTDGRNVPQYTLFDDVFDVNDHSNYVDRLRVRIDNDLFRDNTIKAGRFDVDYVVDNGFFTNFTAGVRWAQQDYLELPGGVDSGDAYNINAGRFSFEIEDNTDLNINNTQVVDGDGGMGTGLASSWVDIIASVNSACQTQFPEDNFLSSQRSGDLVTNVADDGTVISSTNSWATFDAACVADTSVSALNSILDEINLAIADRGDVDDPLTMLSSAIPALEVMNSRTIDVEEVTKAFYAMTNYETSLGALPVSGNIGVRVVQTEVEATGYRSELTVTETDGVFTISEGSLIPVTQSHDYTTVLPSATAIVELTDDKLLRFGVFRALSRPDPADMGFGRSINVIGEDEDATSLEDLIQNITASGNPSIDPLKSWNFDAGFEWYPNEDSIFAVSAYYKLFQGGFENVIANETYVLNGQDVVFPVAVQQTSDQTSNLFGIEVTAAHRFSYLPGLLSGLGAKVSYNYVDSNFEFEDSRYGDLFTRQLDGSIVQTNEGIIAPGGLPGLSSNTLSAQVYYQIGKLDLQVNYKYRDSYFQPFVSDGTRLRYIGDVGVWEARASYYLTDNVRLTAEAINLFSAPKEQFAFVRDDLYEVNDYGPRIFFGARARF
ncbi:TonB-dependent receptor [Hyphococcus sp.]|uniref:TonB-dependent receptor n=1 Tax=Hyphococcus sp. TaxID=2038636 RepID=UPI003CCBAD7B